MDDRKSFRKRTDSTNTHNCRFKMKTNGYTGDTMECTLKCSNNIEIIIYTNKSMIAENIKSTMNSLVVPYSNRQESMLKVK